MVKQIKTFWKKTDKHINKWIRNNGLPISDIKLMYNCGFDAEIIIVIYDDGYKDAKKDSDMGK